MTDQFDVGEVDLDISVHPEHIAQIVYILRLGLLVEYYVLARNANVGIRLRRKVFPQHASGDDESVVAENLVNSTKILFIVIAAEILNKLEYLATHTHILDRHSASHQTHIRVVVHSRAHTRNHAVAIEAYGQFLMYFALIRIVKRLHLYRNLAYLKLLHITQTVLHICLRLAAEAQIGPQTAQSATCSLSNSNAREVKTASSRLSIIDFRKQSRHIALYILLQLFVGNATAKAESHLCMQQRHTHKRH